MFMHLFNTVLLVLDADYVTRDFFIYLFLFSFLIYDICLFNSTYILKAIKTCNICLY